MEYGIWKMKKEIICVIQLFIQICIIMQRLLQQTSYSDIIIASAEAKTFRKLVLIINWKLNYLQWPFSWFILNSIIILI